ncbi:TolC family protein [Nitrosophilus labii]|uniref:TolC family protein n=1 Tax=Nitrosophilus labii TaxID=2706014 RepID=UPI001656E39C|nr:TolC family protein [Nitrosophilus labii]
MRYIIFISLIFSFSIAKEVNLVEIINEVKKSHPMVNIIEKERNLLRTETKLSVSDDALEAEILGAYAEENSGVSGNEFYLNLSKEFLTPKTKDILKKSGEIFTKAKTLQLQSKLLNIIYSIKSSFYETCFNKQIYRLKNENLKNLKEFAQKMRKAYELGEISKKDILSIEMELQRAKNDLLLTQNEIKNSLMKLKELLSSTKIEFEDIVCIENIKFNNFSFNIDYLLKESLNIKAKKLQIEALKNLLKKYESFTDRYSIKIEYSDEFGTKKYTAGIGIPLYFSSSKRELEKRKVMQNISLKQTELNSDIYQTKATILKLKTRLDSVIKSYEITKKMEKEQNELNDIVQKSYLNGESSILELLSIKRDMIDTKIKLIEYKKEYFNILFEIFSTAGIKEMK